MPYKIRYRFCRRKQASLCRGIRLQMLMSGVLLLLSGLVGLWSEGERWLEQMLLPNPLTLTELAVEGLAQTLANGGGWYEGVVVWCRTIIHGGMV